MITTKFNRFTTPRKVALGAFLLVAFACADDGIRMAGDAMVDAIADLRDGALDAGEVMRDAGRVEAQTCSTCSRRFEVLARFAPETPVEPFSVAGVDRFHVGGCSSWTLEALFGEDWVFVGAYDTNVVTYTPVADMYRLRNVESSCAYVVQGETNTAR